MKENASHLLTFQPLSDTKLTKDAIMLKNSLQLLRTVRLQLSLIFSLSVPLQVYSSSHGTFCYPAANLFPITPFTVIPLASYFSWDPWTRFPSEEVSPLPRLSRTVLIWRPSLAEDKAGPSKLQTCCVVSQKKFSALAGYNVTKILLKPKAYPLCVWS